MPQTKTKYTEEYVDATCEALAKILDPNERSTIANALSVAAERFKLDAEEFDKVAAHIKAGLTVPMFAGGKPGIEAAERLAEQFRKQESESREIAQLFDS